MSGDEELTSIAFRVITGLDVHKVCVTGDAPEIGNWHVHSSVRLSPANQPPTDNNGKEVAWESIKILLPKSRFPLSYRCFVNGHRSSPTARPMSWDVNERTCEEPPPDGIINCKFFPNEANVQSGWVTSSGVGAFQLRVDQPRHTEPMVQLIPPLDREPHDVILYEAIPHDPAVPEGKPFAVLDFHDMGVRVCTQGVDHVDCAGVNRAVYIFNGHKFEDLGFRIDVVSKESRRLIARGLVPHNTFQPLEGSISCSVMTPELKLAGMFKASFLVVVACEHPNNSLKGLRRTRWTPHNIGMFYDIGHRGSGASKKDRSLVRENTVLSFQKAASNHADFVEFDVHVTQDGEVVVHHDFEVKLNIGDELVKIGIASLTSKQLQSRDIMLHTIPSRRHRDIMRNQEQKSRKTLKRATSDMGIKRPSWDGSGTEQPAAQSQPDEEGRLSPVLERNGRSSMETEGSTTSSTSSTGGTGEQSEVQVNPNNDSSPGDVFRIADKVATLREAFRNTPEWLGFNIEVKYPTDREKSALSTRFYSRNYFVDAVLKVVFEEAGERPIIFSSFDPDCTTLLSLKQPKYPIFFLTCAGTDLYDDPRMNSLEAALVFARASMLQGVVAESSAVLKDPENITLDFHYHGLFLFTWGHLNNRVDLYLAQKNAGVDAIILDDVTKMSKATKKDAPIFKKQFISPESSEKLNVIMSLMKGVGSLKNLGTAPHIINNIDE